MLTQSLEARSGLARGLAQVQRPAVLDPQAVPFRRRLAPAQQFRVAKLRCRAIIAWTRSGRADEPTLVRVARRRRRGMALAFVCAGVGLQILAVSSDAFAASEQADLRGFGAEVLILRGPARYSMSSGGRH